MYVCMCQTCFPRVLWFPPSNDHIWCFLFLSSFCVIISSLISVCVLLLLTCFSFSSFYSPVFLSLGFPMSDVRYCLFKPMLPRVFYSINGLLIVLLDSSFSAPAERDRIPDLTTVSGVTQSFSFIERFLISLFSPQLWRPLHNSAP